MMVMLDLPDDLVRAIDTYRARFKPPTRPKKITPKYTQRLQLYRALRTRSGVLVKILKEAAARELTPKATE